MRILLVNYEYPPVGAGAGNATAHIARSLAVLGHSPIVLTAAFGSLPERSNVDQVEVIRVPAKRVRADRSNLFEMATYVASAAIALPGVLRSNKPDAAIVFFSMPCGPLGLLAKWWARIPYIISLRGGDVPGTEPNLKRVYSLLAPLRRLVLRKAAAVIANSAGLKDLCEIADPVRADVIPNGVDTDFFRPPAATSARPFSFLFVGRFQPQKNIAFLLEVVAVLRHLTTVPFRVVMVGDGPLRAELTRKSSDLGLDDVVIWHGWCSRDRLLAHYQEADCFLNPSRYEGMPNTVLEAMACGLPVVASAVPGNDAVVFTGETGFLFRLGEFQDLATSMRQLLADPMLARKLGEAGRKRVLAEFSWRNTAQQYVDLIVASGISR